MPVDKNYVLQLRPEDKVVSEAPKLTRDIKPHQALDHIAKQGAKIAKLLGFLQLHDQLIDAAQERARKATHIAARLAAKVKQLEESKLQSAKNQAVWYDQKIEVRTRELVRQNELLREVIKHLMPDDAFTNQGLPVSPHVDAWRTIKKPYPFWAAAYDTVIEENPDEVIVRLVKKMPQEMTDDTRTES